MGDDDRRIVCTMPGRHGDILWSLPTVRAISRHHETPVTLVLTEKYGGRGFAELIRGQDYIHEVITLDREAWPIEETAPMTPRVPLHYPTLPRKHRVYDLCYKRWPELPLAAEIFSNAVDQTPELSKHFSLTPWITVSTTLPSLPPDVVVGFSDEYIELKMGVLAGVVSRHREWLVDVIHAHDSRHGAWQGMPGTTFLPCGWITAAKYIADAAVFFGCLSGLWVLANALGVPTVIMEPNENRWNPIFHVTAFPGASRNRLVFGNDGKPTFDLRHVADELEAAVEARRAEEFGKEEASS